MIILVRSTIPNAADTRVANRTIDNGSKDRKVRLVCLFRSLVEKEAGRSS